MGNHSDESSGDGTDDDKSPTGDSPEQDPISPEALNEFLDGLEEEMGASFGVVSSRAEMLGVKREIARKMGVQEEYHHNCFIAFDEHGEDGFEAFRAVEERYDELRQEGTIREDPDWEDPVDGWNRQLNRHLEGEDTIYSHVDNEV